MENKSTTQGNKRLKVLEVAQVLRDRCIKEFYLWNKLLRDWTDKDLQVFENIKSGGVPVGEFKPVKVYNNGLPRTSRDPVSNVPRAVIRLSDGREFPSVRNCSAEVGIPMSSLKYKALKHDEYKFKNN